MIIDIFMTRNTLKSQVGWWPPREDKREHSPVMIPRALSVAEPERVRGGKPLETPGTEEKETQKKDKMRKERKKCGQYLYAQGDKKGKFVFW